VVWVSLSNKQFRWGQRDVVLSSTGTIVTPSTCVRESVSERVKTTSYGTQCSTGSSLGRSNKNEAEILKRDAVRASRGVEKAFRSIDLLLLRRLAFQDGPHGRKDSLLWQLLMGKHCGCAGQRAKKKQGRESAAKSKE